MFPWYSLLTYPTTIHELRAIYNITCSNFDSYSKILEDTGIINSLMSILEYSQSDSILEEVCDILNSMISKDDINISVFLASKGLISTLQHRIEANPNPDRLFDYLNLLKSLFFAISDEEVYIYDFLESGGGELLETISDNVSCKILIL